MIIQLPTGKTANVDSAWWLGLTDDEQQKFYENDHGSELDPACLPVPNASDPHLEGIDEITDKRSLD